MRKLLAGLALFLATGCTTLTGSLAPSATVHRLEIVGQGWCSAVTIAPDTALTAQHCTTGGNYKRTVDGKPVTAVVQSPDSDLATLTVPGLQCPCAEIGKKPLIGSDVKAIGYPGPLNGKKRETETVHVRLIGPTSEIAPFFPAAETYIYTDRNILIPGDSGGGLFQRQGIGWKLVGISSHIVNSNPFFQSPISSGFVPVYK